MEKLSKCDDRASTGRASPSEQGQSALAARQSPQAAAVRTCGERSRTFPRAARLNAHHSEHAGTPPLARDAAGHPRAAHAPLRRAGAPVTGVERTASRAEPYGGARVLAFLIEPGLEPESSAKPARAAAPDKGSEEAHEPVTQRRR